ncbi:MAG: NAD(P)-dependent glycerol-3-phosphate dehydrogenase [Nitrospinae bacterium]|nr:NAD(P)-dependent glycerol-3-phosphate dehydrogenase [Nitrospinota bacterium]
MDTNKIGVVGAGSWGTVLSQLLAERGCYVDLWVYETDLCETINRDRENSMFMPGLRLSEKIRATNSLAMATRDKRTLVLALPTHVTRQTVKDLVPHLRPGCLIVNASKGIENDSLFTVHQILRESIGVPCSVAAISGPTFAAEIARHCPSALVAAAEDLTTARAVQEIFSTPTLKVFASSDLLGVELGGALKNVIAIATGISDGLELGYNARAALITRGLVEMKRIGTALGARPETFSGLSGMGDLVLTCTGDLSRNRTVGIKLGRGEKLADLVSGMKRVAEGVLTVKSAYRLKEKLGIQASIIQETFRVLYEEKPARQALTDLLKVEISTEFAGVKGLE